jgi:hypothetical protein
MPTITVEDDDFLYRRLAPSHVRHKDGTVNSTAYKFDGKPDQHISVELATMTTAEECAARSGRPGFGTGVLKAREVRALGFTITHDGEGTPSHAVIEPVSGENTADLCSQLADITAIVIMPDMPNQGKKTR